MAKRTLKDGQLGDDRENPPETIVGFSSVKKKQKQ
jgi:hypothetical protein